MDGSSSVANVNGGSCASAVPQAEWKVMAKDLFAGTIAGVASKVIEYPFDTIKVRQQTEPGLGPIKCLTRTLRNEGVAGLYRGVSAPIVGAMAENAIIFAIYSKAKRMLLPAALQHDAHAESTKPVRDSMIAGFAAGVGVAFWLTPVELVKVRLQAEGTKSVYKGPIDCIVRSFRDDGAGVFFKGHSTTLLRESIGGAAYFGAYESVCRALLPAGHSRSELHPLAMIAAGASAGIGYWTTIFPADTVKSRVQAQLQKQNVFDIARGILKHEGIRGFYSGYTVTVLRALPSNAVIFATYELISRQIKNW